MDKAKINTKYGKAYLNSNGYYVLFTEDGKKKPLHREIFEDHYKCTLPSDIIIHHKDGNKTNNRISNLFPLTRAEHGRVHAEEFPKHKLQELGRMNKDIPKSESHKQKIAETLCLKNNSSGYYRVRKEKVNGKLRWRYRWRENGKLKSISRKNIPELKKEVLARGLEWFEIEDGVRVS